MQGDTVTTDMSGMVEIGFILDYKVAEVQRRPDAAHWEQIAFMMKVPKRNLTVFSDASGVSPGYFDHDVWDVSTITDDSAVRVVFIAAGRAFEVPKHFQVGDDIDFHAFYRAKDQTRANMDPVYLGTVHLR